MSTATKNLKDLILNADDLRSELMEIPEWGCTVMIRAMDGETRGRFAMSAQTAEGDRDDVAFVQSSARLVAMTVCDPETGTLIFTNDDVPMLSRKSAAILDRISKVAFAISGITEEDRQAADETFPE